MNDTDIEIENQKQYIEKVKKINETKNLTYTILTMGCQLNENDSEKISGMIEQMGYTRTNELKHMLCKRKRRRKVIWKIRRTKKDKRRKRDNHSNWWMYDARKTHNQ